MRLLRAILLPLLYWCLAATPAHANLFGDQQIPRPEQALQVETFANPDAQRVDVIFSLLPQVYLYRQSLGFTLYDQQGRELHRFDPLPLPDGTIKDDEIFGEVEVYFDQLTLALPLPDGISGRTVLTAEYQGCLDNVLCYPPQESQLELDFGGADSVGSEPAAHSASAGTDSSGFFDTLRSQDANVFSRWLGEQNLAQVLLLFFVGGLLLALTPCVFPMIPILSGIIAGQDQPTARRGFFLSTAYVLGMALPYTLAGLLVALFGAGLNLQFMLQQPAAIIVAALIFAVLSLGMFGVFTLQLPAALRDRLNAAGDRQRGGSLGGAALIGAISGLIVSPCVTPILAGALMYVASSGDAVTGALTLFTLALGMGVPLIIFGTGGSHLLPRAGGWMDDIKVFFGVVMLAVAAWLLSRIVPAPLALALYGILLLIYGAALGAFAADAGRVKRGVALVLALYGALLLVGAAAGGRDPLQPLAPFTAPTMVSMPAAAGPASQPGSGAFVDVKGQAALNELLADARAAGRPVMVDFFAEWCVACKVMEATTLADASVLGRFAEHDMLLVRADITEVNADNQAIMAQHNIFGLPSFLFFDAAGNEVADSRVLGEMNAGRFLEHLNQRVIPAI